MMLWLSLLPGALVGLGVTLVVAWWRPAPVRFEAALARLDGQDPGRGRRRGVADRLGGWLVDHLTGATGYRLRLPRADLRLLDKSVERFLLEKLALAGLGLVLALGWWVLATWVGFALGWRLPVLAALAVATAASFVPDVVVRSRARAGREEFRRALTAYLDLVALERAAGAGPAQALELAAHVGHSWCFARVAAVLATARHGSATPWQALARLGEELAIPELTDLARIAELAGNEGATILDTLLARAASLRRSHLAAEHARANQHTTTMAVPMALCGLGFLVLLAFPALYRMLAG